MININKKYIKYIFILLFIIILVILFFSLKNKLKTVDIIKDEWGLGNYGENVQPIGSADKETLQMYNSYYVGDENEKCVYLTFDSGYENGYTSKILDVLKEHNVKGAFFLVGNYLEKNPELVKRMVKEGHIVGNHTYHHKDMRGVTDKETFTKELTDLEDLYKQITGKNLKKYYRPPEGKFNEENLKMANELGYKTIFWSLAYNDWNNNAQKSSYEVFETIMPRLHNGTVFLLHSTSKTNSLILSDLISKLKQEGYTFKTLDDLTK